SDRSRPQHHDEITRLHLRQFQDGLRRDTSWLGHRCVLECKSIRNAVQTSLRNADELGHGAVHPIPETQSLRAKVVATGAAAHAPHICAAVSLTTRSPSLNPVTSRPTAAISPPNSWPRITG